MHDNYGVKFKNEKFVHGPDILQFISTTTKTLTPGEDITLLSGTLFEYSPEYFL